MHTNAKISLNICYTSNNTDNTLLGAMCTFTLLGLWEGLQLPTNENRHRSVHLVAGVPRCHGNEHFRSQVEVGLGVLVLHPFELLLPRPPAQGICELEKGVMVMDVPTDIL